MSEKNTHNQSEQLLRVWQIIGDRKRGIEPILPISRSSFYAGIQQGKYPKPIKLSERTSAWRKSDIDALVQSICQKPGQ